MKCPKCKSNNLLQLGVKATRHSDLVCLDCDWDNMEELLLRKTDIEDVMSSMGVNLAGGGEPYQTMVIEESLIIL